MSPFEPGRGYTEEEYNEAMAKARADLEAEAMRRLEARPWFVVIERLDMLGQPLPDYAVGPFSGLTKAKEELDSEVGMVHALLTIDAKADKYQAIECYLSQELEANAEVIAPALEGLP